MSQREQDRYQQKQQCHHILHDLHFHILIFLLYVVSCATYPPCLVACAAWSRKNVCGYRRHSRNGPRNRSLVRTLPCA